MSDGGKIKKERAGYIYRPNVDYKCSECVFYDAGICKMYKGDNRVKEYGSCTLWQRDKNIESPNFATTTKKETSYEENREGFSCKRCEYFMADVFSCKKVDKDSPGDTPHVISKNACCNFWDKGKPKLIKAMSP